MAYQAEQEEFKNAVLRALGDSYVGKQLSQAQIEKVLQVCDRSFEKSAGYSLEKILHAARIGIKLTIGQMRVGTMDIIKEKLTGNTNPRLEKSDELRVLDLKIENIIRDMLRDREGVENKEQHEVSPLSPNEAISPELGLNKK